MSGTLSRRGRLSCGPHPGALPTRSVVHRIKAAVGREPEIAPVWLGQRCGPVDPWTPASGQDRLISGCRPKILGNYVPVVTKLFDRVGHGPIIEQCRIKDLRS